MSNSWGPPHWRNPAGTSNGDNSGSIDDVKTALEQFNPLWEDLSLSEKNRMLWLLLERVEVDAKSGEIELTFQQHGVEALSDAADSEEG